MPGTREVCNILVWFLVYNGAHPQLHPLGLPINLRTMNKLERSRNLGHERFAKWIIALIIAGLLVLGSSSCAGNKCIKKCDGQKGVKTSMGTL